MTPTAFEQHVAYLTSSYRVMSLPEAVQRIRDGKPLPLNAVAITFDDGYADNLAAARVLEAHGANATFYITAGCLSGESPFWPCEIRQLLARIQDPIDSADASRIGHLDLLREPGRPAPAAIRTLARLFKSHTIPVREALRDQLRSRRGGGAANRQCSPGTSCARCIVLA